ADVRERLERFVVLLVGVIGVTAVSSIRFAEVDGSNGYMAVLVMMAALLVVYGVERSCARCPLLAGNPLRLLRWTATAWAKESDPESPIRHKKSKRNFQHRRNAHRFKGRDRMNMIRMTDDSDSISSKHLFAGGDSQGLRARDHHIPLILELDPPLSNAWRIMQYPLQLAILIAGNGLSLVIQSLYSATVAPPPPDFDIDPAQPSLSTNLTPHATIDLPPPIPPVTNPGPLTVVLRSLAGDPTNGTFYSPPPQYWDPMRGETQLSLALACLMLFSALSSLVLLISRSTVESAVRSSTVHRRHTAVAAAREAVEGGSGGTLAAAAAEEEFVPRPEVAEREEAFWRDVWASSPGSSVKSSTRNPAGASGGSGTPAGGSPANAAGLGVLAMRGDWLGVPKRDAAEAKVARRLEESARWDVMGPLRHATEGQGGLLWEQGRRSGSGLTFRRVVGYLAVKVFMSGYFVSVVPIARCLMALQVTDNLRHVGLNGGDNGLLGFWSLLLCGT
ncbi:hypothetical protein HK101_005745, partial [Irineochytrium annulatum]